MASMLDRNCGSVIPSTIEGSDTVFCRRKMRQGQEVPTLSQICCVSENTGELRGKGFCYHTEMRATQENSGTTVLLTPVE